MRGEQSTSGLDLQKEPAGPWKKAQLAAPVSMQRVALAAEAFRAGSSKEGLTLQDVFSSCSAG